MRNEKLEMKKWKRKLENGLNPRFSFYGACAYVPNLGCSHIMIACAIGSKASLESDWSAKLNSYTDGIAMLYSCGKLVIL